MDLVNLTKKREERQQIEAAKRLNTIAEEVIDFLAAKDLEMFEVRMIVELAKNRVNVITSNYIDPLKLSDVIKPKEQK